MSTTPAERDEHDLKAELDARFRAPLMKYFLRRLPNRADAEDLTQEVFARVIGRAGAADIEKAEPFIFRTALNMLRDHARRQKSRLAYADIHIQEEAAEELSPERVIQAREALEVVMSTLRGLGEKTRDIFLLHRLENMKYREIADLHGVSVSAVEKHMIKALAELMKHLDGP